MALSNITVLGLVSDLKINGSRQRFVYNATSALFSCMNTFVPTASTAGYMDIEFLNYLYNGFKFRHSTSYTDTLGTLKLVKSLNNGATNTDILTISDSLIQFATSVQFTTLLLTADPTLDLQAATKRYVDNHTWLSSSITDLSTTLTPYALKTYVDSKTWLASSITNLSAVVQAYPLSNFAAPVANLNMNSTQLINLATPTIATNAATMGWVQSSGALDTAQLLSYTSSLTWNWISGNLGRVTLTGNTILNITVGTITRGTLFVTQDVTGGRTLTLGFKCYRIGATNLKVNLSTIANVTDMLQFQVDGAGNIYLWNVTLGYSAPSFVIQLNPFGSATSITQAQLQAWYDSYTTSTTAASPDTPNPSAIYPISGGGGNGYVLWLGANTWYYGGSTWSGLAAFNPKGNFGSGIAALARGI